MIDPSTGEELLKKARKKGATEADLVMVESRSFDVRVRLGKLEQISQAEGKKLGLRLFFGKRTSISATSDFS
ncbi:MAG TPA: DNA gyrase modulator, partial [Nitrospiria bacterium]|nr:DNA gyrase modulator [Nitrospiria bacterium]